MCGFPNDTKPAMVWGRRFVHIKFQVDLGFEGGSFKVPPKGADGFSWYVTKGLTTRPHKLCSFTATTRHEISLRLRSTSEESHPMI